MREYMLNDYDVVIIGAGPSGCSAAINLQPGLKVAIIDRTDNTGFKVGESLPPACKRLLQDMQLWDEFVTHGHLPYYGTRSVWADNVIDETDFLRDLDGHGWHLDRGKFENWLRHHAGERGTHFYSPAKFKTISRSNDSWSVCVDTNRGHNTLKARLVIDAGGRSAPLTKQLNVKRTHYDHMVCSWLSGDEKPHRADAGFNYIQATADGWWYTAALPGNHRVLSFHTDARLDTLKHFRDPRAQLNAAKQHSYLAALLERCEFSPGKMHGYSAAHSSRLTRHSGNTWLAVGDAAMCMDPLSSQGMFNGLYTGLLAAKSIRQLLNGTMADLKAYSQALNWIWQSYEHHKQYWYALPAHCKHSAFWKLKHQEVRNTLY